MRVNTSADLSHLLSSTTDAFGTSLHALLDADRHQARQVLRASLDRRTLAAETARACRDHAWVPAPQLHGELRYVADIARVGALCDDLAREIVGSDSVRLLPTQRMEAAVLLDAGGQRLRQLADGAAGSASCHGYRRCGSALAEVADRGGRDRSTTMVLCGALAVVLLQASRHACR